MSPDKAPRAHNDAEQSGAPGTRRARLLAGLPWAPPDTRTLHPLTVFGKFSDLKHLFPRFQASHIYSVQPIQFLFNNGRKKCILYLAPYQKYVQ